MIRLVVSCLIAILMHPPLAAQEDLTALAQQSADAVVLLKVFDATGSLSGTGTGFFVASDRIVTNHHVVAGAHRVHAVLADGGVLKCAGVLASDDVNDLAMLKAETPNDSYLKVSDSPALAVGQPIAVFGSPAGLGGTLSNGIVSAIRPDGLSEYYSPGEQSPPVFQISAPISPGSSGSPVMNMSGEVVGVAVSYLYGGQNLNFAVPLEPLRQLIHDSEGAQLESKYGAALSISRLEYVRNLGISLLVFVALYLVLRRKKGGRAES